MLPGVGAFAHCIGALRAAGGIEAALNRAVIEGGTPFLGICVGMQLLASEGHEHGVHRGLGWIPGKVTRLVPDDPALKIPHMGWNAVTPTPHSSAPEGDAYFVHSYRFDPDDPLAVMATSDHGGAFPAIVAKDNIRGVQFHPEKSQAFGLAFLRRWLLSAPLPLAGGATRAASGGGVDAASPTTPTPSPSRKREGSQA